MAPLCSCKSSIANSDLSEAFTGDIPVFEKSKMDEKIEEKQLNQWVNSLPEAYSMELKSLFL